MMNDLESYEMHALRKELRQFAEKCVEQEVEIMLLQQRVEKLREVIKAENRQRGADL